MTYEDLENDYILVNPDGKLARATVRVTWTLYERNDNGRVYKDHGAGTFGNFKHWFDLDLSDVEAGDGDSRGFIYLYGVSNQNSVVTAPKNQILISLGQNADVDDQYKFELTQWTDNILDFDVFSGVINNLDKVYVCLKRNGTVITLDVYSTTALRDAAGNGDVVHITDGGSGSATAYRYIIVTQGWGSATDGTDHSSGFIENVDLYVVPTVITDAATAIGVDFATLNGDITVRGGENCDERGFEWGPNPNGETWTAKQVLPTTRGDGCGGVVNGRLYFIGGYSPTGAFVKTDVYEYDPVANLWNVMTSIPDITPHTYAAVGAVHIDGKIYVWGGIDSLGNRTYKDLRIYDVAGDSWGTGADFPVVNGIDSASAISYGGKIYIIGGYRDGAYSKKTTVYDPISNTYDITKTDMTTAKAWFNIAEVNGKIYCIGGGQGSGAAEATNYEYDVAGDSWAIKTAMPAARWGLAREPAVIGDCIYVSHGLVGIVFYKNAYAYDPSIDTWRNLPDASAARDGACCGVMNNNFYVVGGRNIAVDDNEMFAPYLYRWTEVGVYGTGSFSHEITGLECETTYYYRAIAHNSEGWGYGDEQSFGTSICAPTDLIALCLDSDSIVLTWTDNSTSETAYYVERDDGGWHDISGALPANAIGYIDNTVVCDMAYLYRVRAYDGVDYSNYLTLGTPIICVCTEEPEPEPEPEEPKPEPEEPEEIIGKVREFEREEKLYTLKGNMLTASMREFLMNIRSSMSFARVERLQSLRRDITFNVQETLCAIKANIACLTIEETVTVRGIIGVEVKETLIDKVRILLGYTLEDRKTWMKKLKALEDGVDILVKTEKIAKEVSGLRSRRRDYEVKLEVVKETRRELNKPKPASEIEKVEIKLKADLEEIAEKLTSEIEDLKEKERIKTDEFKKLETAKRQSISKIEDVLDEKEKQVEEGID